MLHFEVVVSWSSGPDKRDTLIHFLLVGGGKIPRRCSKLTLGVGPGEEQPLGVLSADKTFNAF